MIKPDVVLAAYKEMFDNTPFEKYLSPRDKYSTYNIVGIDESVQYNTSTASCTFAPPNPDRMIPNMTYDYTCSIRFRHVENNVIDTFFKNKHYDYNGVENILNELSILGMSYGFIKHCKIKDLSVEAQFKSTLIEKSSSFMPVGVVTLSNALIELDPDYKKMVYTSSLNSEVIFIIKDNIIQPVLLLSYPVSAKKRYYIYANIHPANQCNHKAELLAAKDGYEKRVQEHLDSLLKKHFKLTTADLSQLSIKDKIDYLKVLEMGSI